MQVHRLSVMFCAAALCGATSAYCSVIGTYTDRATWIATSLALQTDNFESFTPATGLTSVASNGVTFTGTRTSGSATLQIFDTSALSFYDFGTHYALAMQVFGGQTFTFHAALPAGITSIGVDLFSGSPSSLTYTVTVAGVPFTVPTFPPKTVGFFGAIFDAPINIVDIAAPGAPDNSLLFLDDFSFGAENQVPEGGTLLWIGTGLVLLAVLRRRARS